MDDLFGMLYNDLEPSKKVLTAVTNNMVDSLDTLIKDGFDSSTVLQLQNGNRALHIAAQKGHTGCTQLILQHGGDPDIQNDFGYTPLSIALRHGHAPVVKILLQAGSMLSNTSLVWTSQQMDEMPTWQSYSHDMIKLLLQATPSFEKLCQQDNGTLRLKDRLFENYMQTAHDVELIKLFLMTGNALQPDQISRLLTRGDAEFCQWLRTFPLSRTLQQQARVAIRRELTPNTLSGSSSLPLPVKLQKYISFEEEF